MKQSLPTTKPAPAQKKRKGIVMRHSGKENVVDGTQIDKNGQIQCTNKQSEKEYEPKFAKFSLDNRRKGSLEPRLSCKWSFLFIINQ
jgi:hypothetical protein